MPMRDELPQVRRLSMNRSESPLSRACDFSPFLRDLPQPARTRADFLERGAAAAVEAALAVSADTVDAELRQRRTGVALAIALGDLTDEFTFEDATRRLSDFADSAIESALISALKERLPGAEVRGITAIALGKLGSRELNYSSDVDLLLLFDPEVMPRGARRPHEGAVRVGRG